MGKSFDGKGIIIEARLTWGVFLDYTKPMDLFEFDETCERARSAAFMAIKQLYPLARVYVRTVNDRAEKSDVTLFAASLTHTEHDLCDVRDVTAKALAAMMDAATAL